MFLSKLHHEVAGLGFKCSAETITMLCSQNLVFAKYCSKSEWTHVHRDEHDCWEMVKTKRCKFELPDSLSYEKKMQCDQDGCSTSIIPEEKFTWLQTNIINGFRCSIKYSKIIADTPDGFIYGSSSCRGNDFKCETNGDITVWNSSIVHKCPFEILHIGGRFEVKNQRYLVNAGNGLLFRPVENISQCGIDMWSTKEGIFITKMENKAKLIKLGISTNSGTEKEVVNNLIVSNIDLIEYENSEWVNSMRKLTCLSIKAVIMTLARDHELFMRFPTNLVKDTVFFIKNGLIFVPECRQISEWQPIVEITSSCHRELPIRFKMNNVYQIGFINNDNIITWSGNEVSCGRDSDMVFTNDKWFQRRGKLIMSGNKHELAFTSFELFDNSMVEPNNNHPDEIFTADGELKEFFDLEKKQESYGNIYVRPMADDIKKSIGLGEELESLVNRARTIIIIIPIVVGSLLIFILIVAVIFLICKFRQCFKKKRTGSSSEVQERLQLNVINVPKSTGLIEMSNDIEDTTLIESKSSQLTDDAMERVKFWRRLPKSPE